jgi:serine/threonine-protein kinase SRPK3
LLEVLKRTEYKGLPLDTIREMTKQILIGLDFLNRICKIIHTDLKPENVLLCLTDAEIKKIVEDGQLTSEDVFMQRLKYYRKNFGFGNGEISEDEKQPLQTFKEEEIKIE